MDTKIPGQTPDATTPPAAAVQPGDTEPRPGTGSPAPAAHRRRSLRLRLIAIFGALFLIAAVLSASIVAYSIPSPSHAGQVIFTSDVPTAASAATCQLGHEVTSVSAGASVYANYFYKSRLTGQTVSLSITKDGTEISHNVLSSLNSNGVDCMEDELDLNYLASGSYEFKLKTASGEVVSAGTLIVTPSALLPSRAGQVIFTSDAPTAVSNATCQLGHQVTSVSPGASVYANYFYKSRLTGQTVTLSITKDGTEISRNVLASIDSNGVDCTENGTNLNYLAPGTYDFKLKTASGEVVSAGTLIITLPAQPPSQAGQVIFTTDAPTAVSNATCQLGHEVTSVSAGASVYANYFYKSRLTGQTVSLSITKDGTEISHNVLASIDSNGVDCTENGYNLATLAPGSYDFKLKTASGEVVSEGTLIVTPSAPSPS